MKEKLLSELGTYSSEYDQELEFVEKFTKLIRNHPSCFYRYEMNGHVTGSAWIINSNAEKVLLIHHTKLNRWLQPGGHADGNSDIKAVALKEAMEETGLKNLKLYSSEIFDLDIHKIPGNAKEPEHEHFDIRFIILADEKDQLIMNHESRQLKWFPLKDVESITGNNESIMRMVRKTEKIKLHV